MADSELLCVEVATLLRNEYARVRVISQGSICSQKLSFFKILDICLAFYCPGEKKERKNDIALAITLVRTS